MAGNAEEEVPVPAYTETPERKEIIDTLDQAVKLLHRRAETHRERRSPERTERALRRATVVQTVIDLLAHDWHDDDQADAKAA